MTYYRIADDVAWISLEGLDADGPPAAYVARLPHGPPTTLAGSACVIWLALADGGSTQDIVAAAAMMWGAEADEIETDVVTLLEELVRVGLASSE